MSYTVAPAFAAEDGGTRLNRLSRCRWLERASFDLWTLRHASCLQPHVDDLNALGRIAVTEAAIMCLVESGNRRLEISFIRYDQFIGLPDVSQVQIAFNDGSLRLNPLTREVVPSPFFEMGEDRLDSSGSVA